MRAAAHNAIRDDLLRFVLDAGFDAEAEFYMDGSPFQSYGRVDLVIHKPYTIVEVKTLGVTSTDKMPNHWHQQFKRYRELVGTACGFWLVMDELPRWQVQPTPSLHSGYGIHMATPDDFKKRLRRFTIKGTPLSYSFNNECAA